MRPDSELSCRPRPALSTHRQGEEAQQHLTEAMTMYREMDMRFWLEQADTAMKELG